MLSCIYGRWKHVHQGYLGGTYITIPVITASISMRPLDCMSNTMLGSEKVEDLGDLETATTIVGQEELLVLRWLPQGANWFRVGLHVISFCSLLSHSADCKKEDRNRVLVFDTLTPHSLLHFLPSFPNLGVE